MQPILKEIYQASKERGLTDSLEHFSRELCGVTIPALYKKPPTYKTLAYLHFNLISAKHSDLAKLVYAELQSMVEARL